MPFRFALLYACTGLVVHARIPFCFISSFSSLYYTYIFIATALHGAPELSSRLAGRSASLLYKIILGGLCTYFPILPPQWTLHSVQFLSLLFLRFPTVICCYTLSAPC